MLHGLVSAQEADDLAARIQKETDAYFANYDTDDDGQVGLAEFKAAYRKLAGVVENPDPDAENPGVKATDAQYLNGKKGMLLDYLAADINDDFKLTRAEYGDYLRTVHTGAEVYGHLSSVDIEVLDRDCLEALVKATMGVFDADGDGFITVEEAEKLGVGSAIPEIDEDGDGKASELEVKLAEVDAIARIFTLEDGHMFSERKAVARPEVPQHVKERFEGADTNSDGNLSYEELCAAQPKQPVGAESWGMYLAFVAMDRDNNLLVDVHEFYAFGLAHNQGKRHKLYPIDEEQTMDFIWAGMDKDGDGLVSKDEYLAVVADAAEFESMDTDNSGQLTKQELWTMLKIGLSGSFDFVEPKVAPAPPPEPAHPAADEYALYTKVGRSWTYRTTTTGDGVADYVRTTTTTVSEVHDDRAVCRFVLFDDNMQELLSGDETVRFTPLAASEGAPTLETITVPAGTFECVVTTVKSETGTTTVWSVRKFPQLTARMVVTGKQTTTLELNELVE